MSWAGFVRPATNVAGSATLPRDFSHAPFMAGRLGLSRGLCFAFAGDCAGPPDRFYAGMRRRRVIRAVDNNRISTAENKGFCNLAVCVWKRNCGYYEMRRASCLGRVLVAAMLRVATSRSE